MGRYLAGQFPPDRAGLAKAHLSECDSCRKLLQDQLEQTHSSDGSGLPDEAVSAGIRLASIESHEQSAADTSRLATRNAIEGYEILSEIHRGAQGVVYKAIQTATKRIVALKMIRDRGYATERQRFRFEREIDLVSSLQHPNIVTIFDSGESDGGLYFAMEYIHGVPLNEHPMMGRLSVPEALDLCQRICEAVNYAHQRGVIHRDLKPSNIRVDASGQPHILDFGLAKAAGHDQTPGGSPVTLTGEFMGTLAYASPEQTRGDPDFIDIRSDVYSLGVILFEMLTDQYPYPVVGEMADILRNITDAEPEPPSALCAEVNDEVQTIVLKALDKEKDRRYQSAGALGEDIRRYLSGEPIDAKRDSLGYQIRKGLRRYRVRATIAAAFVLLVLGFAVSMFVMYQQQVRLRERAELAQTEAQTQASIARAVNEFLNDDLLAAAAPGERGVDVSVRQVLDAASQKIAGRFPDSPLVEASIRMTLGITYWELGEYKAALPHIEIAVELMRKTNGDEDADTLDAMNNLAVVYKALMEFEKAETLYSRVLKIQRRDRGVEDRQTLSSMNNLAVLLRTMGQLDEAAALHQEALNIRRRVLGPDDPNTLNSMANLAVVLREQGKLDPALSLQREAFEARRRLLTEKHPATLASMYNVALLLKDKGDNSEAERLLRRMLEIAPEVFGDSHPRVASVLVNLGIVVQRAQGPRQAEPILRRALDQSIRVEDERSIGAAGYHLGDCLTELGHYEEAEEVLRQAYQTLQAAHGEDHRLTLQARERLDWVSDARSHTQKAVSANETTASVTTDDDQ